MRGLLNTDFDFICEQLNRLNEETSSSVSITEADDMDNTSPSMHRKNRLMRTDYATLQELAKSIVNKLPSREELIKNGGNKDLGGSEWRPLGVYDDNNGVGLYAIKQVEPPPEDKQIIDRPLYIGKASDFYDRIHDHFTGRERYGSRSLLHNKVNAIRSAHNQDPAQPDVSEAFKWCRLLTVNEAQLNNLLDLNIPSKDYVRDFLSTLEILAIAKYNTLSANNRDFGYNLTPGGDGGKPITELSCATFRYIWDELHRAADYVEKHGEGSTEYAFSIILDRAKKQPNLAGAKLYPKLITRINNLVPGGIVPEAAKRAVQYGLISQKQSKPVYLFFRPSINEDSALVVDSTNNPIMADSVQNLGAKIADMIGYSNKTSLSKKLKLRAVPLKKEEYMDSEKAGIWHGCQAVAADPSLLDNDKVVKISENTFKAELAPKIKRAILKQEDETTDEEQTDIT